MWDILNPASIKQLEGKTIKEITLGSCQENMFNTLRIIFDDDTEIQIELRYCEGMAEWIQVLKKLKGY